MKLTWWLLHRSGLAGSCREGVGRTFGGVRASFQAAAGCGQVISSSGRHSVRQILGGADTCHALFFLKGHLQAGDISIRPSLQRMLHRLESHWEKSWREKRKG